MGVLNKIKSPIVKIHVFGMRASGALSRCVGIVFVCAIFSACACVCDVCVRCLVVLSLLQR